MGTISGISNVAYTLESQAQSVQEVQMSFQDALEEANEAGKKDRVESTYEKSSKEKFLELMEMSIGERYFELYLKQEGMTREEFEALPPEEQEKIVQSFKEEMETQMNGGKTGTPLL